MSATPWQNSITHYGEEAPDQLLAHPLNPKFHPKAQQDALAGAIGELGWLAPVIVNSVTGHVIDGHARIGLAISRHEATVPVAYVSLTEAQEALALATFDPIGALAAIDKDNLDALLRGVTTDDAAVRRMLSELADENGLEYGGDGRPLLEAPEAEVDRAEELRAAWGVEQGQLWVAGKHRVLVGDATKAEDVEWLMGGEKAALLWTDPPYGVEYVGKTKDALTLKNDGAGGLLERLVPAFKNATAGCEPGAPWYIAHPAGALCLVFGDAIREAGWRFHQTLIWVKDSMVLGHSDYHFKHEPIFYGFMPGEGRPGRGNHEGSHWYGDHAQVSVFEIPRPKRSEEHPTMKPPELVERCIRNSSMSGDIVLDLYVGSGTTMVAAERTGRAAYGLDIDPKYIAVTLERLAQMGLEPKLQPLA